VQYPTMVWPTTVATKRKSRFQAFTLVTIPWHLNELGTLRARLNYQCVEYNATSYDSRQ